MNQSEKFNPAAGVAPKAGDLARAAETFDVETMRNLMQSPLVNPNDSYNGNTTPLMYLAPLGNDYLEDMKTLIKLGAKVNEKTLGGGLTALMTAVVWNQDDAVDLLVSSGANPFLRDSEGRDALHWAQTQQMQTKIIAARINYSRYIDGPAPSAPTA